MLLRQDLKLENVMLDSAGEAKSSKPQSKSLLACWHGMAPTWACGIKFIIWTSLILNQEEHDID